MAFKRKVKLSKYKKNWTVLLWAHELLRQYLYGELTDSKKILLKDWEPQRTQPNKEDMQIIERIVAEAKIEIFKRLGIQQPADSPTVANWTDTEFQPTPVRRFPIQQLKKYAVAAVLAGIIFSGSTLLFRHNNNSESHLTAQSELSKTLFATTIREKKQITLPDGSTVYMNGGSKLKIQSSEFNKEQREVWLDEGEAFFQVTKNPQKPFIVHSQNLTTVVKGTSFNVKAYHQLNESSVMVRTGRVEVNSGNKILGILTPDKQLVYHKNNGQYEESDIHPEDAMAWCDGRLVLHKAGIDELKLRISQIYGIEIKVEGNAMEGKYISSSFRKNTSFESVMESVCLLHGLHYKINNKQQATIYQ